jgi:hypothetical protein
MAARPIRQHLSLLDDCDDTPASIYLAPADAATNALDVHSVLDATRGLLS